MITAGQIAENSRYSLTRYTVADADKIIALANELDLQAAITSEYEFVVQVWLAVNAPDANTLYAKYEIQSAVALANLINTESVCFSTLTKSGGSEKYPLSNWKKWIKAHKTYQAKLFSAFEAAKEDMINQAINVNWWAA